ncbi:T cell receptor alpha chain MC.7.G5-like [Anomalospiza imberbis]|uniref:T cell receptor alpha chain MC.7.G5-like n=1 Tax=Anomalospiza imberbis TaxID=187417 RepID=UPI00358E8B87
MLAGPGPWLLALVLALWPAAVTGQVALEQQPREVTVQEGKEVTFECSMKGDDMSDYYTYWYRQGPGAMEWVCMGSSAYGEGFQDRFKGRLESSKNNFTLQILAAEQGDAATYYCAADPPWSLSVADVTAALVFGNGTQLTVEPNVQETSVPQVIVMKSQQLKEGGSTGKAACLARNFLTKDISLEMPSQEVVYEQNTSIWTSEGLYNAIKVVNVTKDTEVTCTAKSHNSTITTQPEEEAEEPVTGASDRVCNSTDPSAQDPEGQRVNMLSMAVLGLRVLLVKSITFNALMIIKLLLF